MKDSYFNMTAMNMKLMALAPGLAVLLGSTCTLGQTPTASKNFVMETTVRTAGKKTPGALVGLPVDSANRTVGYFDGLGRPLQTVQWQGSPARRDIVTVFEYDALGREAKKYLPYSDGGTADGGFRAAAGSAQPAFYGGTAGVVATPHPYSQTVFEASPLNRVLEQGAPGAAWQPYSPSILGSGHTARTEYGTNAANEVKLWEVNGTGNGAVSNGSYVQSRLYKTVARDENEHTTEEFRDLQGRVVLKRSWRDSSTALSTYYVYDDMGSLRYVLPPRGRSRRAAGVCRGRRGVRQLLYRPKKSLQF
jgi:hypothetical protein